ncbi:MAG: [FeFe] hydrogenase, group A [Clostridiales bacterium]|nr:[FeFe] hydrogenase, group A [Candidatus Crickella equi]
MAKINLVIDGKNIAVEEGTTILNAAAQAGIKIPTLCYFKDLNDIGACRICVVEVEGQSKLNAACNTLCEEGMVVKTNSPRVLKARETNLKLILAKHDGNCVTCKRSGNCKLQELTQELNINDNPYEQKAPKDKWDMSLPFTRKDSKCISCMRCIEVCDQIQGVNVWDLIGTGSHARVGVTGAKTLTEAGCAMCGQCVTHCPVGALIERDDTQKLFDAIADPDKIVVAQVAPAVRAAWGDELGLNPEFATEKRMAAAMRRLGVDYVFDTNFTADLTIMEEGSEFIERMTHPGEYKMPMFTSCCPGWVRFVKMHYPEYVNNLSTAKSPQQMFGAVAKSYFAEKIGKEAKDIFCVSIMPCTAKKYECDVPEVNDASDKDVDMVLTTREFGRAVKKLSIIPELLPEEEFDSPLGSGTGAAVIFGATGGVMEAALRSAYFLITGEEVDADAFKDVRGLNGWRDATFQAGDITVRVAIASGLANTRALMEEIKSGRAEYDFVEIMACPGGCAGGGGQPIVDGAELAGERKERLYVIDKKNPLRRSHENPDVQAIYKEFFEKPLSHKSHELLHTKQEDWSL